MAHLADFSTLTGLGFWRRRVYEKDMRKAPAKSRQRSEDEILDQATRQLLRATKEVAKKQGKSMNDESLRREGYSERFIQKVRDA
jgi:hypothetical protein